MLIPDDHAYHEIAQRLLARLDYIRIQPQEILVVGSHPEIIQQKLQHCYPTANIISAFDFSAVSLLDSESFDLVFAHFALARERDPQRLLQDFSRVLRDEGLLLFTSLGPDTLMELRQHFSYTFSDMHDVGDWMQQLRFADPVVDREVITLAYEKWDLFIEDLQTFAQCKIALPDAQQKIDDCFPITLEVIYGHAWKVMLSQTDTGFQDEIAIPIDRIVRR